MTWLKLDDTFADHPKIMAAGPLAAWLHVCALLYAARMLTDGFIPLAQVRKLADLDDPYALATQLVNAGLWTSTAGGYQIHDYLDYNPSRDDVLRRRAYDRDRKSSARIPNGSTDGIPTDSTVSRARAPVPSPYPSPTPPQTPPEKDDGDAHVRARATSPNVDNSLIVLTAETIATASFVRDDFLDIEKAVVRSLELTPRFDRMAAPREAELFVRWRGYRRKPPDDWYRAWLNWLDRAAKQQPAAAVDETYPEKIRRWKTAQGLT